MFTRLQTNWNHVKEVAGLAAFFKKDDKKVKYNFPSTNRLVEE